MKRESRKQGRKKRKACALERSVYDVHIYFLLLLLILSSCSEEIVEHNQISGGR
jgi:hypothetical protein